MKDPELDVLLNALETRSDLTVADFDGVARAFVFLLPDVAGSEQNLSERIGTTDTAMHLADVAFPNGSVRIHGRANDRDGHWH